MINLHERMLPTSAGVEPATSWSPVGRCIQLSHRGLFTAHVILIIYTQQQQKSTQCNESTCMNYFTDSTVSLVFTVHFCLCLFYHSKLLLDMLISQINKKIMHKIINTLSSKQVTCYIFQTKVQIFIMFLHRNMSQHMTYRIRSINRTYP